MENNIISLSEILSQNLCAITAEQKMLEEEKNILLQSHLSRQLSKLSFPNAANQVLSLYGKMVSEGAITLPAINEKAILTKHLADCFSQEEILSTVGGLHPVGEHAQIACWNTNHYSVVAFDRFSRLFSHAEQIAAESFSDVCEHLSRGNCDFGIIPVENSADGRLIGFYRMLDKHELKICAICDVEDDNGENFTRLALVSNVFYRLEADSPLFVELSTVSSISHRTLDLVRIADHLGVLVVRFSSTPLYYRENVGLDTITFSMSQEKAHLFFIYLYLFGKDTTILGTYIQI